MVAQTQERKFLIKIVIDPDAVCENIRFTLGKGAVLIPRHLIGSRGKMFGKIRGHALQLFHAALPFVDAGALLKAVGIVIHAPQQAKACIDRQKRAGHCQRKTVDRASAMLLPYQAAHHIG